MPHVTSGGISFTGNPLGPVSPTVTASDKPKTGSCKAGQKCSDKYWQCVNAQLVKATLAGAVEAVGGAEDQIVEAAHYVYDNRAAFGAAASIGASYAGASAGGAVTVGTATSEFVIPAAAVLFVGYRGYKGAQATNAYMNAHAPQCDKY